MSAELFLELGTEEIPAGFIPRALNDMENLLRQELEHARIPHGEVTTFATPRRLAISVAEVSSVQQRQELELTGPPARIAYDGQGQPTKAAIGFARTNGVEVADLKIVQTEKGDYLGISKIIEGGDTSDQLPEILTRVINKISFKKSMRWKDLDVRFARPVHWIVALYGGEVVPVTYGDLQSGNRSRGHRFMAPDEFRVTGVEDYVEQARQHHVMVDIAARRQLIEEQLHALADQLGGRINPDDELLQEVTFLVESPQALAGSIEAGFLQLPSELLITSMREHQRYFTLVDEQGTLLPHFITIANTQAVDPAVVVAGNERVLKARLADAMFFWREDQKTPLEKRLDALKKVVYQAQLGTSFEKVERFSELAAKLAEQFAPDTLALTRRAALLAKCDLETGMVYEFPELQGVMGREYALLEGEDPRVATAIYEHYLPTQAGGVLPADDIGAFVSIADKIDTICGCFSVGLIPTGTADPYALRRNAIGILSIILDRGYALSIPELIARSVALLDNKRQRPAQEVVDDVVSFIRLRLVNQLAQQYPADVVDAVLSASFTVPVDALARIKALTTLKQRADFDLLSVAFKRVGNMVKQQTDTRLDEQLLVESSEKDLYQQLQLVEQNVSVAIKRGDYVAALESVARLRKPVDAFFDDVMVMVEDASLRTNRLALLAAISTLFSGIADFSRLS
ncbi:glycine--tRNA ligase subunit beta [Pelovirga terrestris]|uniref:Glycine--tRNA ligase beta subunit n=1 Tax=Pelovirga terrestris TaxID=2771352 RepID=A0A8J6UGQ7_9BACT|nr:glycine--tRNA ligase subunit beta [Pelovirga terrestris]MBD1400198.1 glycine--tRNA ligase subunit beta [Pelovirga terrestris]